MYSNVQLSSAGKPHIRFETRSEEDRSATFSSGRKVYVDKDYVIITPQGGRDSIENLVEQWFKNIESRAQIGQYDNEWLNTFRKMYAMYKEGKEMPVEGTPLRMLAHLFSPSEIANCAGLQIQTLEQLASANEEALARLGIGSREWKHRAQEALRLSEGKGDSLKIAAIQTENEDLKARITLLENTLAISTRNEKMERDSSDFLANVSIQNENDALKKRTADLEDVIRQLQRTIIDLHGSEPEPEPVKEYPPAMKKKPGRPRKNYE